MTSFFSAEGGPIWIKFPRLLQNDMSTAVIWSKLKPQVEFQYGGRLGEFNGMLCHIAGCCQLANSMSWSQSYVSHCRVLPPGEFNDMSSQSHVSRCRVGLLPLGEFTVMIPEPLTTLHIENRLCHILLYFVFLMQFGHWRAAAFVSSPIHKRPPIQSHMWPTELHLCSLLWA